MKHRVSVFATIFATLVAAAVFVATSHVHAHHESGGVESCVACSSASDEEPLTTELVSLPELSPSPSELDIGSLASETDRRPSGLEPTRGPPLLTD